MMFVCAGKSEQFDFAVPMGIGLEEVAIRLTERCLHNPPQRIIFIGTAGSYGEHEPFDILSSSEATQIENSFFTHGSYSPIENRIKDVLYHHAGVSRETDVIVNSSNYITTDKGISAYYREKGISIENMEFYAVLQVASYFQIPARGILIVTNFCDSHAHKDFISNHQKAMKKLEKYIKELYHL
jgi:nucleoside phosphorylase